MARRLAAARNWWRTAIWWWPRRARALPCRKSPSECFRRWLPRCFRTSSGPKRALELVLTGEAITAERARDLGLVNRLVPEAQLQTAVNELIGKITAQSGAVLGMAKKAVLGGMGMSLRDSLRNSMSIFLNELYRLEDSQEGLRALLEKRKPQWKNR